MSVNSVIVSNGSALNPVIYLEDKVLDVRTAETFQTEKVGTFTVPVGTMTVRLKTTGVTVLLQNNGWIKCTDASKTMSL